MDPTSSPSVLFNHPPESEISVQTSLHTDATSSAIAPSSPTLPSINSSKTSSSTSLTSLPRSKAHSTNKVSKMSATTMEYSSNNISFVDPMHAEQSFRSSFDLEDPQSAASSYAKLMHQHTMTQLEAAARSANRRGSSAPSHTSSLSTESSLESEGSPSL